MPAEVVQAAAWRCQHCGHKWLRRGDSTHQPYLCPKCRKTWP